MSNGKEQNAKGRPRQTTGQQSNSNPIPRVGVQVLFLQDVYQHSQRVAVKGQTGMVVYREWNNKALRKRFGNTSAVIIPHKSLTAVYIDEVEWEELIAEMEGV